MCDIPDSIVTKCSVTKENIRYYTDVQGGGGDGAWRAGAGMGG